MDNIIKYFVKEPEREFHIRELARLAKKSPTTVSKLLLNLEKENLLVSARKLNHLFYKANAENKSFKDFKACSNIGQLRRSGLIDYLDKELNHPEAIVLFGSFRKAEDIPASDVDLLVISSLKKQLNLKRFEDKIGRKIDLFVHSNAEIEKMKTKNKELLNNWLNGVVLSGFWEVFK